MNEFCVFFLIDLFIYFKWMLKVYFYNEEGYGCVVVYVILCFLIVDL